MLRFSARSGRVALGVCAAIGVFFGARWYFLKGQPERLRDFPWQTENLLGIRNGVIYVSEKKVTKSHTDKIVYTGGNSQNVVRTDAEWLTVRAEPVTGGAGRVVGEDRQGDSLFNVIKLTGKEVIYTVTFPKDKRVRRMPGKALVPVPGKGYVEKPALVLEEEIPTALRSLSLQRRIVDNWTPHFRLKGGGIYGQSLCVAGDKVYWLEVDDRSGLKPATAKLLCMRRGNASPKVLKANLSRTSSLLIEDYHDDVIWLLTNETYTQRDIYRITLADDRMARYRRDTLPKFRNTSSTFASFPNFAPVTWKGRIYFKQSASEYSPDGYLGTKLAMASTALDGSDTKVYPLHKDITSIINLLATDQVLYIDANMKNRRCLLRFDPSFPERLSVVLTFPPNTTNIVLDRNTLYCIAKPNAMAADSTQASLQSLYRFRLPEK